LSGRGLCDELITRPEESYRLCCVVVCDLETSRMGAPYIYDIRRLRVKCCRLQHLNSRSQMSCALASASCLLFRGLMSEWVKSKCDLQEGIHDKNCGQQPCHTQKATLPFYTTVLLLCTCLYSYTEFPSLQVNLKFMSGALLLQ